MRWNVKVAQTLKSLGERRAEDLQKCKEQAAKEGDELLSRMRAKAEYDKLLTAKDVGSATFKVFTAYPTKGYLNLFHPRVAPLLPSCYP